MNKTKAIIAVAMLTSALSGRAQTMSTINEPSEKWNPFVLEGSMLRGFEDDGMTPISAQLGIAYRITDRLYPLLKVEYLSGHYKQQGLKTFYDSGNLNVGLGYSLIQNGTLPIPVLTNIDVRAYAGTSFGSHDWKYNYLGTELIFALQKANTPTIGIGYRYMDSHKANVPNYKGFYVSLGLRL